MKVQGISWIGVGTDRYAETLRLFTGVMGLEVEASEGDQALLATPGGQRIEIFGREGPGKSRNMPPAIAFEVEDVAAARAELIAAGIEVVGEIGCWGGHEWAYFRSPDDYLFAVKRSPPPAGSPGETRA